jgi:hypothetical protein
MMKSSFFYSLLVAALAGAMFVDSASSGNRNKCPGDYDNGQQMDIGRYWYECRDGQVVPKGCLTPADEGNRRVAIDETFDTKQYRMQCVLDSNGFLSLVYKACVSQNGEHDVGAQWDDGTAYFTCVKEGNNVRVITLGCVDQGKQMKLDDRIAKGDFIYQCKKSTDGTPKMNKVGCVHDGKKFNIGETFEGAKVWYTCTDSGAKIVGCMYESHRLQDGDHFTKDDMMYVCRVNDDQTDFAPFACLQREESGASIERRVGCFWVEGKGSNAYEYTCKADDSSKKIAKTQTQCVYRAQQGTFKLQPGCVTLAETIAVGCLQDSSSGKLRIETYRADQIDQLPGLRQC